MVPKSSRKSRSNHRSTLSLQKTEIIINVYDLLPPGRFSTILWTIGSSLLHSGVVINGKEYAFGGHDRRGMTGVYWTKPGSEPPGGTFRSEILQGFTLSPQNEIDAIIKQASEEFKGTAYNLLNKNCNHFTSYLCEKLTGRSSPPWLNRAASIGVALPCVVPKEWIAPPDFENAEGELLDEDDDAHESTRMLHTHSQERHSFDEGDIYDGGYDEGSNRQSTSSLGQLAAVVRDTSGRVVPPADRAPVPRG